MQGMSVYLSAVQVCIYRKKCSQAFRAQSTLFKGHLFKSPIKEEVHGHYNKVSFPRFCQVTVHIQINEH